MEIQLIKTLLNNNTYLNTKPRLRQSIFSDELAQIYNLLGKAHTKYETDIKPDDLYSLWLTDNPVATTAEINDFRDLVDQLKYADKITDTIATDVI